MKRVETESESEFDYEAADIVVKQVMEQLVEVKLEIE